MGSDELAFVNELLRGQAFGSLTLEEQRAAVEAGTGSPPEGTTITPVDADGVACEWLVAPGADEARTVVALRGGGYCLGSLVSNRHYAGLLAATASARVLSVGYRNAPEHPHPAALDDAVTAWRWLLASGVDPGRAVLAGNSAGGGLALATLLALRDAGDPLPALAAVVSPWTDLTCSGDSLVANAATEVMLDPTGVGDTAALYAADLLGHPYVSPLHGDHAGLPPLLIQVSDAEILLDDSVRFAGRATGAGVDVSLRVTAGVPHVWPLFAGFLPEADVAWAELADWLAERLP